MRALLLVLTIALTALVYSQENLLLSKSDNSVMILPTTSVDSITFGAISKKAYLFYGGTKLELISMSTIDSLHFSDYVLPKVTTTSATFVNSTFKINCVANLDDDGGCAITQKGICWSTTKKIPTISDSLYFYESTAAKFYGFLPAKDISKTYYVRAYATNCLGTSYGNVITVQPLMGQVTYTLSSSVINAGPAIVNLLKTAMDSACYYYNRYTPFKANIWISYNAGVPTAQAGYHSQIDFGSNQSYMWVGTAMHEMAHYFGSGTTAIWQSKSGGQWKGPVAQALCQQLLGTALAGDSQHYWPSGINYRSEVSSATDLINHAKIVKAMLIDDCGLPSSW